MPERPDDRAYEPLIHSSEVPKYHRQQRHKSRLRVVCALVVLTLVVAGAVLALYVISKDRDGHRQKYRYRHAAVASDVSQCSTIGKDLLQSGGNAVDSAIGTLLCMGLTDPQSMGLGGGFFMTIYIRESQTAVAIDARETAPGLANETMFEGNPNASSTGPLSIAVPGEVSGYWLAHQRYGRLPWRDLFQPAIVMAELGFPVERSLAQALRDDRDAIFEELSLRSAYVNSDTGEVYGEGETMRLPELAVTLKALAAEGEAAFYNGSLTDDILHDLKDIGSIITREDLLNYRALLKPASEVTLKNTGLRVFSPPPPSSGVLLSFMLNVLDGNTLTPSDLDGTRRAVVTLHRAVETFKFAYAKRTDLADEDFVNVTALVANLTSRAYAAHIRSLITDNSTHNVSYYGPSYLDHFTTGTAHLSLLDAEGNAVSVTSTVNARFGSKRRGRRTGVVLNDEMDDFSSPNITNIFGIPPSPANFIAPGKRPLSSMCPAVLVRPDDSVRMVVGAAGGPASPPPPLMSVHIRARESAPEINNLQ